MPSTPRTDLPAAARRKTPLGLAGLIGAVVLLLWALATAPPPPEAPLVMGAGYDSPQYGGTFVFHHETNIRSMDPLVAFDEVSAMAIRLLFDGLLDYDEHTRLIPSLAEAMPEQSGDGRTFLFRLRRGVRFHNGRELVAEDVRWSMEHMLDPDLSSPGYTFYKKIAGLDAYRAGETQHISGITVPNQYSVQFELTEPDQTFLNAMAMPFAYPVPRENHEAHPDDVAMHPVGTGPFRLAEWERGVRALFVRNPDYWRPDRPYVDRMVYLENMTRHVAVMRFRQSEIHHVHRFSPADFLWIKQAEAWRPFIAEEPRVNIWGIVMNCEMAPFDNVHVRRAVSFAIDGQGWNRARAGRLRLTGQPIPPSLLGYDPNLPEAHHYDLERAREEMSLAGHAVSRQGTRWVAQGIEEPIEYLAGQGDTARYYGELAQADLAQIGIHIEIKQVSFTTYLEDTGRPHTARIFLGGWNQDFPDPSNFLDILFHSDAATAQNANNRAFYKNPELDAILDEARVEQDLARREALYREASRILVHDAPWAFVWNDTVLEAWQPYVRGYYINNVFTNDYRNVWLDLPPEAR